MKCSDTSKLPEDYHSMSSADSDESSSSDSSSSDSDEEDKTCELARTNNELKEKVKSLSGQLVESKRQTTLANNLRISYKQKAEELSGKCEALSKQNDQLKKENDVLTKRNATLQDLLTQKRSGITYIILLLFSSNWFC